MTPILYIVTGAPGAGKTTALTALLQRPNPYVVFDVDWLLTPASHLAQSDIRFASTTWPAYNTLWLEILHAVSRNGKVPILFAPFDVNDLEPTAWYQRIAWLLLDCDDHTRQTRLSTRAGWSAAMITDAIRDAHALRTQLSERVNTATATPNAIAEIILQWVAHTQSSGGR